MTKRIGLVGQFWASPPDAKAMANSATAALSKCLVAFLVDATSWLLVVKMDGGEVLAGLESGLGGDSNMNEQFTVLIKRKSRKHLQRAQQIGSDWNSPCWHELQLSSRQRRLKAFAYMRLAIVEEKISE